LGFIGQKGYVMTSLPLSIFLIILGAYGFFICWKLYERWRMHMSRAGHIRNRISQLHPNAHILELRDISKIEHKKKFPKLEKLKLYKFWLALHLLISFTGIIFTIIILVREL
jgi:hypothetical protein